MKTTSIAVLLIASQASGKFLRHLDECPTPGGGGACPASLAPVACGEGYHCIYDNACLANLAGFMNCLPVERDCPVPGTGIACPLIKKEVICNNECTYDNLCLANAAGYASNVCRLVPPPCNPTTNANCPPPEVLPPPTTNPPAPCNPTTGANCSPPTSLATSQSISNNAKLSPPDEEICPAPGVGIACPMNIDRVACGTGFKCIYDNACLANAAGFVHCQPMEETCPTPGTGIICPMNLDPVMCGSHQQCVYDNACLANAAGFVNCLPMEETCPPPGTGIICPMNLDPVKCGSDHECVYDNECLANAAGFVGCLPLNPPNMPTPCNPTTGANCPPPASVSTAGSQQATPLTLSIPMPPMEDVCPTPGSGIKCPLNLEPVACGEGFKCIYDNDCLANAAGFVNCLPMEENCPAPGAGIVCPMNVDPVKCGTHQECVYDNGCLANAAGFVNCVPANPPAVIPPPCNPTTGANCPPTVTTAPPCNPTTSGGCNRNHSYLRA